MFGRFPGMPGGNLVFGILGLIFTALLVAATIICILMLIDAARAKGMEVKGGRLAGFWIVGLVLTPITLALYVLCVKPVEAPSEAPAFETAPTPGAGPSDPRIFEREVPFASATTVEVDAAQPTVVVEDDATLASDGIGA